MATVDPVPVSGSNLQRIINIREITIHPGTKGYGFELGRVPTGITQQFHRSPNKPARQYVGKISKDGCAEKAGLKRGDYVLEVNDYDVTYSKYEEVNKIIKQSTGELKLKIATMRPRGKSTPSRKQIVSDSTPRSESSSKRRRSLSFKRQVKTQDSLDASTQSLAVVVDGKGQQKHSRFTGMKQTAGKRMASLRRQLRGRAQDTPREMPTSSTSELSKTSTNEQQEREPLDKLATKRETDGAAYTPPDDAKQPVVNTSVPIGMQNGALSGDTADGEVLPLAFLPNSLSRQPQPEDSSHPSKLSSLNSIASPAPTPTTRVLTISDLSLLMTILHDDAHFSSPLGIHLGMNPSLMHTLKLKAQGDPFEHLRLVLETRLSSAYPPLTLQELHDVVYGSSITNQALAKRLLLAFRDHNNLQLQPLVNPRLSPAITTYSAFLDTVYKTATPSGMKGGPAQNTTYTKLIVVKKDDVTRFDADEFLEASLRSSIDRIAQKEMLELKDIFKAKAGRIPRLVLVEGVAGIGKTTLVWELCRMRHTIKTMKAFSVVLFLSLHKKDVQEAKSLLHLLCLYNSNNKEAVEREITSKHGKGLLLILDGFDEVPGSIRKSFYLADIIRGFQYPNAAVLVTTRPSAKAELFSLHAPDRYIHVLGFSHELIDQYTSSAFSGNFELLSGFQKYTSANPAIESLMQVPLNCNIVMRIYQEHRKPVSQTITELYSELTLSLLRAYLLEKREKLDSLSQNPALCSEVTLALLRKELSNTHRRLTLPRKLKDLREKHWEVYQQLLSLAKFAYENTLEQKVIFEDADLPEDCSTLGLMNTSQPFPGCTNYSFFHLTMQEFLSAYHISQLHTDEQKMIFEQYSNEKTFAHLDTVWRFVAGLTKFRDIGWDLVRAKRGKHANGWVTPFLIQCLYEAQVNPISNSVLGTPQGPSFCSTSVIDQFALGYCIAAGSCTWKLVIRSSSRGSELLEVLAFGLNKSQGWIRGTIACLDLSFNPSVFDNMTRLSEMPQKIREHITELRLCNCNMTGSALDALCGTIPVLTSLKHLDISGNQHVGFKIQSFFNVLLVTSHLETLGVSGVPIDDSDIPFLSSLIQAPNGLRKLKVGDTKMQQECTEDLLKTVLSRSSLQTLTLFDLKMHMTRISFTQLAENSNITALEIELGTIKAEDISSIAHVLLNNTKLESIHIGRGIAVTINSDASQVDDALRDLADALEINNSLRHLHLHIRSLANVVVEQPDISFLSESPASAAQISSGSTVPTRSRSHASFESINHGIYDTLLPRSLGAMHSQGLLHSGSRTPTSVESLVPAHQESPGSIRARSPSPRHPQYYGSVDPGTSGSMSLDAMRPSATHSVVPQKFSPCGFTQHSPLGCKQRSSPRPMQWSLPVPTQRSPPELIQQSLPGPTQRSSPGLTQRSPSGPIQQSSPGPTPWSSPGLTQPSPPGPTQSSHAGSTQRSPPDLMQQSLPGPTQLRSPGLTQWSSPGLTQLGLSGPTQRIPSGPTQRSPSGPIQQSSPGPTQWSSPGLTQPSPSRPIQRSSPGPMQRNPSSSTQYNSHGAIYARSPDPTYHRSPSPMHTRTYSPTRSVSPGQEPQQQRSSSSPVQHRGDLHTHGYQGDLSGWTHHTSTLPKHVKFGSLGRRQFQTCQRSHSRKRRRALSARRQHTVFDLHDSQSVIPVIYSQTNGSLAEPVIVVSPPGSAKRQGSKQGVHALVDVLKHNHELKHLELNITFGSVSFVWNSSLV